MLQKSWGAPTVTKDGVTVVKEIELEDKFENVGAAWCGVAQKTSDVAGDGTTTATVLARAIFSRGLAARGAAVRRDGDQARLDVAVEKVVEALKAAGEARQGPRAHRAGRTVFGQRRHDHR